MVAAVGAGCPRPACIGGRPLHCAACRPLEASAFSTAAGAANAWMSAPRTMARRRCERRWVRPQEGRAGCCPLSAAASPGFRAAPRLVACPAAASAPAPAVPELLCCLECNGKASCRPAAAGGLACRPSSCPPGLAFLPPLPWISLPPSFRFPMLLYSTRMVRGLRKERAE